MKKSLNQYLKLLLVGSALLITSPDTSFAKETDTLLESVNEANIVLPNNNNILPSSSDKIAVGQLISDKLEENKQNEKAYTEILDEVEITAPLLPNQKKVTDVEATVLPKKEVTKEQIVKSETKKQTTTTTTTTAKSVTSQNTVKQTPQADYYELTVESTAYTAYCNGCSGITATGINLKANPNQKVVAVDPSVIPLGSKVEVPGYGIAVAGDTGGAIKGNKIDVYVQSNDAAYQWGRKTVTVKVYK